MSKVYFIGDLHFGQTGIEKFRKEFPNEGVMRQYIMDKWIDTVGHRDKVFIMGDAAFTHEGLDCIGALPGRKVLVRGNHDTLPLDAYYAVFDDVLGAVEYKGFWLTHIPIHPSELYGRHNIHGHCHRGGPMEIHQALTTFRNTQLGAKATYFNTCAEFINYTPISFDEIKDKIAKRIQDGK